MPIVGAMTSDRGLTEAVVASFDRAADPRLRDLMQALVRHLHAFSREVGLTEDEWFAAIDFVTRTGQKCDDTRQEFVLLSDTLGLSMLTVGLNQGAGSNATEPTVFGPFFVEGSPEIEQGGDLAQGASGPPCWVDVEVVDLEGRPIQNALVEVWQADEAGFYDVQYESLDHPQGRGHLRTDAGGRVRFWTVRPVAYPIPDDGPVGAMLRAAGRGSMRPAHIHFMIAAPGHRRLITHLFDREDEWLERDAVFGVKPSLIVDFVRHEAGEGPGGRTLDVPWYSLEHRLVLAPDER
jgi:hydroxyquinol 1,2-dioxygenase